LRARPAASANPAGTGVVVSQVYGGGGNTGATLTNDFIELYNPTAAPISLAGWSVQYGSAAGVTWQVTSLAGSIPAGRYYLVQQAAGAGGTTPLPTPDATGSIAMSATSGKVALVSSTTALSGSCPTGGSIVDFVGYGGAASCFEGSGAAPDLTTTTAALRAGGGATDTDSNTADFAAGTPIPRASVTRRSAVLSTVPANGATGVAFNVNIAVTFSEAVNVAGSWFNISCATSGIHAATVTRPHELHLDPGVDFAANESCTVTVLAANVTDQDASDPPDNMASDFVLGFQTLAPLVCGDPATLIHDVQGNGLASPLVGNVVTIEGVVVGDFQASAEFRGFFVQEEDADADADPATSEGIFVVDNNFGVDVSPGDVVRVRGRGVVGLTTITSSPSRLLVGAVLRPPR
jgi:predicted extracellular nuclease